MQWPGLDVSQHSTAEAEAVVLLSSSAAAATQLSPRWAADVDSGGSPSPDSPLSLTQNSPAKGRRPKRGLGRTYFNSSRSISSQDSSPLAATATAVAASASSPFDHSLHTFVRSPRWADQQPAAHRAARTAQQQSILLQSSVGGSVAGVQGSAANGDASPPASMPGRSGTAHHLVCRDIPCLETYYLKSARKCCINMGLVAQCSGGA